MECDKCGEKTFIIFITRNHKKLCDCCWDKIYKKSEWELIEEKNKRMEELMGKKQK